MGIIYYLLTALVLLIELSKAGMGPHHFPAPMGPMVPMKGHMKGGAILPPFPDGGMFKAPVPLTPYAYGPHPYELYGGFSYAPASFLSNY
ncbi:unnamed protein product [Strongylus vulgaris]|uniref:Uncharacterized protein n=1 Tax=Strongylus vulgaris TaxID=40348 RepID=A0A3P7JJG9_STRVU|nr:unnamed protein product [Strongylus vulgaris]